jgi:hypothetical protein
MKHKGEKFHIDFQDFMLEVHVIGYRTKGESIVVLFKEGEYTFYSMVIDNYRKKYASKITNRTAEILTMNGVKRLPLLVMTHPHQDHILDMDVLIDKYCCDESKFCSPSHSFDIDSGNVHVRECEKKILRKVRKKNIANKSLLNPVGVVHEGFDFLKSIFLYDNDDPDEKKPFEIEINALTPVVSVNEANVGYKTLDPNDLSVSVIICVNGYYLFFGADTTNDHIEHLDSETMTAVKFVKIPHHGSDTADKLVSYFCPNQLDYACSTTFDVGNSHLPLDSVLNLYSNVSKRVDVIGCASKDKRKGVFGEMIYQFKLGANKMVTEVKNVGVTRMI